MVSVQSILEVDSQERKSLTGETLVNVGIDAYTSPNTGARGTQRPSLRITGQW